MYGQRQSDQPMQRGRSTIGTALCAITGDEINVIQIKRTPELQARAEIRIDDIADPQCGRRVLRAHTMRTHSQVQRAKRHASRLGKFQNLAGSGWILRKLRFKSRDEVARGSRCPLRERSRNALNSSWNSVRKNVAAPKTERGEIAVLRGAYF